MACGGLKVLGRDAHGADSYSQGSLERMRGPTEAADTEKDQEEMEDDDDDEGEEEEEEDEEMSLQCRRGSELWPLNPYAPNRTLSGAVVFAQDECIHNPLFMELPEPVPAAPRQTQSQVARTAHHCHSLQSGRVGGRPLSLCGPSSPLPGRHISTSLKPAPLLSIDISSGGDHHHHHHPGLSPTEHYHMGPVSPSSSSPPAPVPLHLYQPRSSSFSRGSDRLHGHSLALDSLPLALGSALDLRREGGGGGGGGGTAGSRGSSSSQASSGNLSDSGRQPVTDCPVKSGGSFKAKAELKPRPFMGVIDKSVRVQGQQSSVLGRQGGGGGGSESFSMSVMDFQGFGSDFKRASFQEQSRDFGERLHQWESRGPTGTSSSSTTPSQLRFPDGPRHRQASLTRDNPALHMAPIKPKRSFIESNV